MNSLAARRGAIVAALWEHGLDACAPHLSDAAFVDGFVSLSIAADASGVDTGALAIAAAEGDDTSTMVARVMLAERAYRSAARSEDPIANDADVDSLCALLEAANADDEHVVRWLASPDIALDIAQIRRAQIACEGTPLRFGLAQSLNHFRGPSARERATLAARAMREVARSVEHADATLVKIVRVAMDSLAGLGRGPLDSCDAILSAAAAMDAVWGAFGRIPDSRARVGLFCDALRRTQARTAAWPVKHPGFLPEAVPNGMGEKSEAERIARTREEENLDPWTWPAPEPARPVVAPPMTFSASRLNAFVKCGRRWFFEYLCDAVEDGGSIHATYGKIVHEALEALHRDVRDPGAADASAILDRFLFELDTAFGKSRPDFASQFEYEVSRLQARRVAPKYVEWLVKQAGEAPMEIAEVESVNRLRVGGHDFVGFIDRVDRPYYGGPVTIFDYKTGRVPDDPRTYLESVRSGDEAQLALYYFMRRARGDEVARIALISVRDARDDVRVLALDIVEEGAPQPPMQSGAIACPRTVLDESLVALVRRCDLLTRDGVSHFAVGEDPPCRFCAYAPSCREQPPELERIFAR